jgi:undecaprenyl-diphosphatase
VEGLTEFLPVSSTGHLILAGDLLDFDHPSRDVFYIAIQTGAMLAVLWEYRARFFRVDLQLWRNLIVAFIPAAVIGLASGATSRPTLFKPVPVALGVHHRRHHHPARRPGRKKIQSRIHPAMTALDALKVGFAQCFALIPGTSRSGATIIGGMLFGLSRQAATEFSFFLAVPTLMAAGATTRSSTATCSRSTTSACGRSASPRRSSRRSW